jgi:hypothetical protein
MSGWSRPLALRQARGGTPLARLKLAYRRGQVTGRHADAHGDLAQRQRFVEACFDHLEDLGEQGFVAAPQVADHVGAQPGDLDEQQRHVREYRVAEALREFYAQ